MRKTCDWRATMCPHCDGKGVVSSYTLGGSDFLGPAECSMCGGSGRVYISPKDRVASWPGGPFQGQWPGAYAKAMEV